MKAKYTKYVDKQTGEYQYEITLPDGTTHWTSMELGNYMYQLEQKLGLYNITDKF